MCEFKIFLKKTHFDFDFSSLHYYVHGVFLVLFGSVWIWGLLYVPVWWFDYYYNNNYYKGSFDLKNNFAIFVIGVTSGILIHFGPTSCEEEGRQLWHQQLVSIQQLVAHICEFTILLNDTCLIWRAFRQFSNCRISQFNHFIQYLYLRMLHKSTIDLYRRGMRTIDLYRRECAQ